MNRSVAALAFAVVGCAQAQTLRVEPADAPLQDYCVIAKLPPESCGYDASFAIVADCQKSGTPLSVSCSIDNVSSYLVANSLTDTGGMCVWNGAFIPRPVVLKAHARVLCRYDGPASMRLLRSRR